MVVLDSIVAEDLPAIAKFLVPKICEIVNQKLNPTELEQALTAGITAAGEQEEKFTLENKYGLFSACQPEKVSSFLTEFFEHSGVQTELAKPFNQSGLLNIDYLAEIFKEKAPTHFLAEKQPHQNRITPWLQTFAATYFDKTASIRFRLAKQDYCQQLANHFDDVKFVGIATTGQEEEHQGKLLEIFVTPDVQEQITEKPFRVAGLRNAQSPIPWEETTGKTIPAHSLLNSDKFSKKVLLGAPGSGKTTLMSYFAVIIAQESPEVNKLGLDSQTDWLPILLRIRELSQQLEVGILEYSNHKSVVRCCKVKIAFNTWF